MTNETDDLSHLLDVLADARRPIPFARLYRLSDLHGERLTRAWPVLEGLPAVRRRRLLSALVELAETSFEVDFGVLFRRFLADEDPQVRTLAIQGLWEDNSPGLIGPLLALLRSDPSYEVRAAAASGLGRFVLAGELEEIEAPIEARIVSELLTIIHMPAESREVRRRAIESVAYACLPEVLEAIEAAYADDDESMRLSAVLGMGRSCDQRWREILLDELSSQSPAMRYEAAVACGEMMLRDAVPTLGRLLGEADRQVSYAAIWALGEIGGAQARRILLDAYDGADEDTQAALDDALGELTMLSPESEWLQSDDETSVDWADEDDEDWMSDAEGWEEDDEKEWDE